jgi:ubiquinone/menaquinone biosynthesis C-methylase UbiE
MDSHLRIRPASIIDFLTGRRPAVRNRVKFLLLSPVYDGFYRLAGFDPHGAIEQRLPASARRVLDLCTGTALVPAVIATARPTCSVIGLDLSPEMLEQGQRKLRQRGLGNASLVRADAGRLPFRSGVFDAVTVSFGLHELPTDVRDRALGEVRRVLRPGGSLIVADLDRPPHLGWLVDAYLRLGEPAHAREVLGEGLVRLLRSLGFESERQPPEGAVPMQILVARLPSAADVG